MIALLVAVAPFAFGQTAVIRGTVTDPRGAVVPQATVTARNVATGLSYPTQTTGAGIYTIPNIQPGTYDVTANKSGFTAAVVKGVGVNVGDLRDQNFRLAIGSAAVEITVTSEAPLVESTRTDVSTVVDERQVRDLPVTSNLAFGNTTSPSNDYMNLAATAPGVKFDTSGNLGNDVISPGYGNSRGTVVNVDGANIMDQIVTARSVLTASLDEVQEFRVVSNAYNAEYGESGGMVVNVITKSGSNTFHGDAHAYFRGRNLEASNYFYNLGQIQNPDPSCSNPGVSVDGCRRAPFQKQEWGFTAGGPFIKNRTFWFGSYEKTHQSTPFTLSPPPQAGGIVTVSQPFNEYMYSVKLDHRLTNTNQISLRFNQTHQLADNQSTQTPVNATADDLTRAENHDHNLVGSLVSSITPQLTNEARVSWHRIHVLFPDESSTVAIKFPSYTSGANFCCPQFTFEDRYTGTDNLSWSHGKHNVKGGVTVTYLPYASGFQQFHFGQYIANAAGVPQSFTWGIGPSNTFRGADGGVVKNKDNIYGVYLQDTWKIWPRFTLNYGLRYDYEAGAFRGGTVRGSNDTCFQGNGVIPACSSDKNNFQPRVGIAWSPNDKMVISASFAEVTEMAFLNVALDSLNFDGNNLLTVSTSDPTVLSFYPNAPPNSVLQSFAAAKRAAGFFGRVRPISPNLKNPEIRHVNLSIRQEITPSTAIELDYIGVFGFGLYGEDDKNFPTILPDPANPGFFGLASRPDSRFLAIRTNENTRTSHYNAGSVTVRRRLASHMQFQLNYTWSKLLTSGEDFFGLSEPAFPHNFRPELGPSANDVRHLFNYAWVFDTTKLTSGGLKWLTNNWALGFTGTVQSGRPYPISTGTAAFPGSIFPGLGSETQQRPNVLPDGTLSVLDIANADGSLPSSATAACGIPGCTVGPFKSISGSLGKYKGLGSKYGRLDISLSRGFRLGELLRLEFKADVFNILNHTNFLAFNGNDVLNVLPIGTRGTASCNGGCIDQTTGFIVGNDGRALKVSNLRGGPTDKDFLNPNWGNIGDPVTADIPRQIQLSAHIRW